MNQSMQPAVQHLFQVSTLDEVSREQLEAMVEEYPCFGYGHYLLSRKLRAEDADRFFAATRKTSLYFRNPFWLQWMLGDTPEIARGQLPAREAAPVEAPVDSPEPIETPALADPDAASAAEILLDSIKKAKELRESLQKINEDFVARTGHPIPTREPVPESIEIAGLAADQPIEEPIRDQESPFVLEETDIQEAPAEVGSQVPPAEVDVHEPSAEADIREPAEQPLAEFHEPPPASAPAQEPPPPAPAAGPSIISESAPLFEPLHTIDYFASQGIRLTLDDNPTDQLGRQLKSFTEWLRMMRRLPQKGREIVPDRVAEEAVQNFAAHSIEGREVVTETMAEVLTMQGMPERARIVYEKLSLLNPEKSAYFAAKIEQLNSH
jgi:hypothetical protein